jgi:hypothetical protein
MTDLDPSPEKEAPRHFAFSARFVKLYEEEFGFESSHSTLSASGSKRPPNYSTCT